MIPKIIHYCWFGGKPLSGLAVKCIDSWKKNCPSYEIKRWDETNFDIGCCKYVKEAYEAKKWAFVSDYARFKIVYEYGGLYFDTDVEIIRPIDELVLNGAFMGCEPGERLVVAPGLGLAAMPKMSIYKEIIDYYNVQSFMKKDGTNNSETVVTRVTNILYKHGFQGSGVIENVKNIIIYPPEYFCPKNYYTGKLKITKHTYSIHHYNASWYEPEEEKSYKIEKKINIIVGIKIGKVLGKPVHYFFRFKLRMREKGGFLNAIKYIVTR